jgi:hypothetical protein
LAALPEGWWVAQCLQYDLAAQAKSLRDLLYELERTLVGHVVVSEEKGLEPFEHLPAAPQMYRDMFAEAIELKHQEIPFRVPRGRSVPVPELRIAA